MVAQGEGWVGVLQFGYNLEWGPEWTQGVGAEGNYYYYLSRQQER